MKVDLLNKSGWYLINMLAVTEPSIYPMLLSALSLSSTTGGEDELVHRHPRLHH